MSGCSPETKPTSGAPENSGPAGEVAVGYQQAPAPLTPYQRLTPEQRSQLTEKLQCDMAAKWLSVWVSTVAKTDADKLIAAKAKMQSDRLGEEYVALGQSMGLTRDEAYNATSDEKDFGAITMEYRSRALGEVTNPNGIGPTDFLESELTRCDLMAPFE